MGLDFEFIERKIEDEGGEVGESRLMKGVKHLCESGITRIPTKYILPVPDRPETIERRIPGSNLKLPVIDLARLRTSGRGQVLQTLARACEEYGFFQVLLALS